MPSKPAQDEVVRVLKSQLEEGSARMLDLEGRLATACKEARAFQHRAMDAERVTTEATAALAAAEARVAALQSQVEAVTVERNAFNDTVG
jgi:hypothetical protein